MVEFQRSFPDDAACARYLIALRWPDGFRCPGCGHDRVWMLETKARHACIAAPAVGPGDGAGGNAGGEEAVQAGGGDVGPIAAHVVLPWVHRVFANPKRWALGVYHGLRPKQLQPYLDEFVLRFNHRQNRPAAIRTLLRIGAATKPVTYKMLMEPETTG